MTRGRDLGACKSSVEWSRAWSGGAHACRPQFPRSHTRCQQNRNTPHSTYLPTRPALLPVPITYKHCPASSSSRARTLLLLKPITYYCSNTMHPLHQQIPVFVQFKSEVAPCFSIFRFILFSGICSVNLLQFKSHYEPWSPWSHHTFGSAHRILQLHPRMDRVHQISCKKSCGRLFIVCVW